MKYNVSWLKQQLEKQISVKYLFFWGHQPHPKGTTTAACMSQWWPVSFVVDEITYPTAEHWMMAQKAILFGDTAVAEQVMAAKTPAEAKALGRVIQNFDEVVWLKEREKIVIEGNRHKFAQNENLKTFLLKTGDKLLVEASPVDRIWGIGLTGDQADALLPHKWKGLNLLGFALMEVRDMLKYSKN